jgi:hypothetical protein
MPMERDGVAGSAKLPSTTENPGADVHGKFDDLGRFADRAPRPAASVDVPQPPQLVRDYAYVGT